MAKMLVPALTLPVRGATELVATMPVPASPSGGHSGTPGCSVPVGSSRRAPSSVSSPAISPAVRMVGSSAGQPPRQVAVGDQVVEGGDHGGVVVAGGGVDREHAARVADPEHLLAGQLPVDVPGQGGQVRDLADVRLRRRGPPGRGGRCSSGAGCCGRTPRSGPPRPGRCWCSARSGTGSAAHRQRRRRGSRASWPTRPSAPTVVSSTPYLLRTSAASAA